VDLYIQFPTRLNGVVLIYLSTGTTLPFALLILEVCTCLYVLTDIPEVHGSVPWSAIPIDSRYFSVSPAFVSL
jgi:hypothetical protein